MRRLHRSDPTHPISFGSFFLKAPFCPQKGHSKALKQPIFRSFCNYINGLLRSDPDPKELELEMNIHNDTPFQKALDAVESLPFDEREEVVEIIRMRLAEDRREEIAANAREAVKAVREKRAKYGTIEDLKRDLLGG